MTQASRSGSASARQSCATSSSDQSPVPVSARSKRLADGHDGSEVRALRRADGERHVSAAGASAASTASTSAGTSIVATAGTTASIVFKPSPVM